MIRIAALNEISDEDNAQDRSDPDRRSITKEAQEAEAFMLYNKALALQKTGNHKDSEKVYHELLHSSLVTEAVQIASEEEGLINPGLILKYSTLKNLASIAVLKETSMEYYLQAVQLDSTDVTLWFKIGQVALELNRFSLARLAFEQGLSCNEKHWPCMDNLCTVLYVLGNYTSCLFYISKALRRDCTYTKGLVLREKIFSEQPSLRNDTHNLFILCDSSIYSARVGKAESKKIIDEALSMRHRKQELSKPIEPILVQLPLPMTLLTWKSLGESLIAAYDYIAKAKLPITLSSKVNLSVYNQELSVTEDLLSNVFVPLPLMTSSTKTTVPPPLQTTSTVSTTLTSTSPLLPSLQTSLLVSQPLSTITTEPIREHNSQFGFVDYQQNIDKFEAKQVISTDLNEIDDNSNTLDKFKRGNKRKRISVENTDQGNKRRSARVRNTTKKKEEAVNYEELLEKFLPSTLKYGRNGNQSPDLKDISDLMEKPSFFNTGLDKKPVDSFAFSSSEKADILQFLNNYQTKHGILFLLSQFCINLAKKFYSKWPPHLTNTYATAYLKIRKHIRMPPVFCKDTSDDYIKDIGYICLVNAEIKLEQWLMLKSKSSLTSTSPQNRTSNFSDLPKLEADEYFEKDLNYLQTLCAAGTTLLGDSCLQFAIRLYWVKSRYLFLQSDKNKALDYFEVCTSLLTPKRPEGLSIVAPIVVRLPNCKEDIITLDQVQKQLESIQRCQSLEKIRLLYEKKEWNKIVELLLPSLSSTNQLTSHTKISHQLGFSAVPERPSQLLLLLDSLYKLKQYKKCLECSKVTLDEVVKQITNIGNYSEKEDWINIITKMLEIINSCLEDERSVLDHLDHKWLLQTTMHMIRIIELAMNNEINCIPPIYTVIQWIILYKLIKHEEDQVGTLSTDIDIHNNIPNLMPSSLMLLYTAHQYLGRKSWCCNSSGALLTFYLSVLEKELSKYPEIPPHNYRSEICHALEQCFYCLYSHPNKKAKARHLQDHGVEEIPITWDKAGFVFEYFKPKVVPEFDSYKTSSMSGELENLLLKLVKIIPEEENPANTIETVQAYIDELSNKAPIISEDRPVTMPIVKEIYYLLADYYFKNKEWGKAIKYYIHDICVCPQRFDSWAGMALARSSRLEAKLSSCEPRSEAAIQKQAVSTLRCFKKALEIDNGNCKLWIEYGTVAYTLCSHSSRQLKQKNIIPLASDMEQLLESKRKEMLNLSADCFQQASKWEEDGEEEWLIEYMLGKTSEKLHKPAKEFLQHYSKAAQCLSEEVSVYPKKIHYHNPPDYAMESVEIHFRLHASLLKHLERAKDITIKDCEAFAKFITDAAKSPFAFAQSKNYRKESSEILSKEHEQLIKHTITATPTDHDYIAKSQPSTETLPGPSTSVHLFADKSEVKTVAKMNDDSNKSKNERPSFFLLSKKTKGIRKQDYRTTSQELKEKINRSVHVIVKTLLNDILDVIDNTNDFSIAPYMNLDKEDNINMSTEDCEDLIYKKKELCDQCLEAIKLCLSRFPQHYKSLYRMAYTYAHSTSHQNYTWARDLLMGSLPWQQAENNPAQGLFAERNKTNLFNGIWRIPVSEIDRSGSFASHMQHSVFLLLEVLKKLNDYKMLQSISYQLQRTPDQGKKYLRDGERVLLAKQAYKYSLIALNAQLNIVEKKIKNNGSRDENQLLSYLLESYQLWQYSQNKLQVYIGLADNILSKAFLMLKKEHNEKESSVLDQALHFCSQYYAQQKQPQPQKIVTKRKILMHLNIQLMLHLRRILILVMTLEWIMMKFSFFLVDTINMLYFIDINQIYLN